MQDIIQLDELTINQIAAGEVIERPASVVKELVENSIDAGSTKIIVEVTKGGIESIKITDNGHGIKKEDIKTAFLRHATSKIRSAKDIEKVSSMGFRGEALASVSAVAKVEMVTKAADEIGTKIVVEAGEVISEEEVATTNGTTITVTNLFFNTPVRYKFLKRDYTEVGYIDDVMRHLALINKDIAFTLINNGKVLMQTNGSGEFKNVIYSLYDKELAENIVEVEYQHEDIKITGVVGKPQISRSNRKGQIFFVNNRYIKDKTLSSAAEKAFRGLLPLGKFGFCILNIEINPAMVDVNVHPAKLEVRFANESQIFKAVYETIKNGLTKEELVQNIMKYENKPFTLTEELKATIEGQEQLSQNSEIVSIIDGNIEKLNENKPEYLEKRENLSEEVEQNKKENPLDKFAKMNFTSPESKEVSQSKIDDIINQYRLKYGKPAEVLENLTNKELVNEEKTKNNVQEIIEGEDLFGNAITESLTQKFDLNQTQGNGSDIQNTIKVDSELSKVSKLSENHNIYENENNKLDETEKLNGETICVDAFKLNEHGEVIKTKQVYERKEDGSSAKILETKVSNPVEITDINVLTEELLTQKLAEGSQDTDVLDTAEVNRRLREGKLTENFDEMYKKAFGSEVLKKQQEQRELEEKLEGVTALKQAKNESIFKNPGLAYKIIGVAFKTYILFEVRDELYMMDQHAAHERVLFEKVKANYYQDVEKDMQTLLLPDIITLSYREHEMTKDYKDVFIKAGFEFEEFGINTIKLTAVPSMCEVLNTKELFLDILDEIDGASNTGRQEIENRFLATVACKAAVKAGMVLSETEIKSLLDEVLSLPNPFTCPHGRPTTIKMGRYDLERKFSRR